MGQEILLDAVNELLEILGESPVDTIEDTTNVDVLSALRTLKRVSRKELSKGRIFNTRDALILNPDLHTKKIPWSFVYLYLKGSGNEVYTKQGKFLFDFTNQTATFDKPITVEAILDMEFENLPEQFREFVIAKAAYEFQSNFLGSSDKAQELVYKVQEAQRALFEYELSLTNPNILSDGAVSEKRSR